jgi:hypothetical protein
MALPRLDGVLAEEPGVVESALDDAVPAGVVFVSLDLDFEQAASATVEAPAAPIARTDRRLSPSRDVSVVCSEVMSTPFRWIPLGQDQPTTSDAAWFNC